jgi:hypothetical protein
MYALSRTSRIHWPCTIILVLLFSGCRTPGAAQPSAPPVAAAPSNAALGTSFEDIDARNRADIAVQLGRPVAPGPATPAEVVAMTRAGVEPRFIICYINRSNDMPPVSAQDVIFMHEQGVNDQVIQAMLTPGSACSRIEVARAMPPRVLILTDPWWPYYYPRYGFGCGGIYHWY